MARDLNAIQYTSGNASRSAGDRRDARVEERPEELLDGSR